MKWLQLVLLLGLFSVQTLAQSAAIAKNDSLAKQLVDRHKKISASKMSMPGFRIQLYFGSERAKAQEIKTTFQSIYPMQGAYLIYQQPNFKVRIGDFRSRIEAQGFLKKVQEQYSAAFIVPDEVKLPNLD